MFDPNTGIKPGDIQSDDQEETQSETGNEATGADNSEQSQSDDTTEETQSDTSDDSKGEESKTEPVLYELPDGRKVDAATLAKEWKDNFLPDYTRKSQKIAELTKSSDEEPRAKRPWEDPDYVPENSQELLKAAVEAVRDSFEKEQRAEQEQRAAVEKMVADQLAEVKAKEPNLDENALFEHANKYRFANLVDAYQNMVDMKKVVQQTEKRVKDNVTKRAADNVSTVSGQQTDDGVEYIPGRSIYESAMEHLQRIKGN